MLIHCRTSVMEPEPISWKRVERGKRYELQAVTSQDSRLQARVGPPFVRLVEHEYFKLKDPPYLYGRDCVHPFQVYSRFATVEPATQENTEHVKVRYCMNYIVLQEVPEL